jgi:hypothetical protein
MLNDLSPGPIERQARDIVDWTLNIARPMQSS